MDTIRAFSPKLGHFFPIFKIGQDRRPPLPFPSPHPHVCCVQRGVWIYLLAKAVVQSCCEKWHLRMYIQVFRETKVLARSHFQSRLKIDKLTRIHDPIRHLC